MSECCTNPATPLQVLVVFYIFGFIAAVIICWGRVYMEQYESRTFWQKLRLVLAPIVWPIIFGCLPFYFLFLVGVWLFTKGDEYE